MNLSWCVDWIRIGFAYFDQSLAARLCSQANSVVFDTKKRVIPEAFIPGFFALSTYGLLGVTFDSTFSAGMAAFAADLSTHVVVDEYISDLRLSR